MSPFLVGSGVPPRAPTKPSIVNAGPSDAEKPFDASAKADVILRSSDSVDFFVLKAILCLASPVFDHMFSVTQETNKGESKNEMKNDLPVVDLAEDSSTLYDLLPQLYPYPKELTDTLEVYIRVGKAAEKYVMDKVLQKLKKSIMNCGPMVKEPVATFAVAAHLGWVEVMREAVHNTLAIPLRDLRDFRNLITRDADGQCKYLHFIGAADYHNLLSWRFACQDLLNTIFASWTMTNSGNLPLIRCIFGPHLSKRLKETGCARSTILMDDRFVPEEIMKSVFNAYTLWGYNTARERMMKDIENAFSKVPLKINGIVVHSMSPSLVGIGMPPRAPTKPSTINAGPSDAEKPFDASAKADVILRSSDSVEFFVIKAILCLASPVFDHMFSITPESNEGESTNEIKNGLPVIDLEEDSTTLYNLLLLLYPYAKEPTDTLEVYTRVAEIAQKYAMAETLQKLEKLVMSCGTIVKEPMATFAVAMRFGWVEVMREAAFNILAIPIRDLVSGDRHSRYLHFIGTADYRGLFSWHFACQDVLDDMFTSWTTNKGLGRRRCHRMRRIFGPHLRERLKETGCARGTALMDDHFVSDAKLESISFNDRELMIKNIENAVSKVTLKINGIMVRAGN